jgi:hypothetical protein
MVDDPGNLLGKEARIDRMRDRADATDAVPELEMPIGVPGQRRQPVAELHPLLLQPLGDPQRAVADIRIGRAPQRAVLHHPAHHLSRAVLRGGVVDDPMQQQGPVLHQAEHAFLPGLIVSLSQA